MIAPLYELLGKYGETQEAQKILSGTFDFPALEIDRHAKEFLTELRVPAIVIAKGPVPVDLPLQEHVSGWKRQKEATASEPTGLSFSHYKAAAQDPMLAEIDRFFRNLPYQEGFSPEAWQFITDVEILKKSGVYDVEKMRTIQLMHSDFNMNNKKLGRDMMHFAESCNILAPEQFGSRKNHQSILAALNKRLTMQPSLCDAWDSPKHLSRACLLPSNKHNMSLALPSGCLNLLTDADAMFLCKALAKGMGPARLFGQSLVP